MFLQSCFIRKNTPELRKKLEELGYKPFGFMHGFFISCDHISNEFETFDEEGLANILKNPYEETPEIVDCGENEELFLALAALRDDSDDNQWFTNGEDWGVRRVSHNGSLPGFDFYKVPKSIKLSKYHKATVEEIIKHFNHYDD